MDTLPGLALVLAAWLAAGACVALCVGTTVIINAGRARYAWTTFAPLLFITTTTLYGGWRSILDNFLPLAQKPGKAFTGYLDASLTSILMGCVILILAASARVWMRALRGIPTSFVPATADGVRHMHLPGTGCC